MSPTHDTRPDTESPNTAGLRVLLLHNRYKLHGGEDVVVQQEAALLRSAGVAVDLLEVSNASIVSLGDKLMTTVEALYSPSSRELVWRRLREHRANLLHVHNFFPQLSPSVYDAAAEAGAAVVQTLHNYRLVCPSGTLFRDGHICTECLGRDIAWPGIRYGCYRGSRIGAATIAALAAGHRARGTWQQRVHRYITLNNFACEIFIRYARLPEERVRIKPNAIPDSGVGPQHGSYALFIGRLAPEKGIATLLKAAARPDFPLPLLVAGTGPLEPAVAAAAAAHPGRIVHLGAKTREQVTEHLGGAMVAIVPSEWHEAGGPLTIGEAFARGVPVVTSRLEPMSSVVEEKVQGLLYAPGDPADLARATREIIADPERLRVMRLAARLRYEELYHPQANVSMLLAIYREALAEREAAV